MGDFNFIILAKDKKPEVLSYKTLLKSFDLDFCLSEPTRVTENSATCTDHFIAEDFYPVTVIKTTVSDHYAMLGELPFSVEMPGKIVIYTRNFEKLKLDDNLLKLLFLLYVELKKLSDNESVNTKIHGLTCSMINVFDKFCPLKPIDFTKQLKKKSSNNVKRKCKKRDAAHKKMVTLPNDELKAKFKNLRNEAKKLIMTGKRKFCDNQL